MLRYPDSCVDGMTRQCIVARLLRNTDSPHTPHT